VAGADVDVSEGVAVELLVVLSVGEPVAVLVPEAGESVSGDGDGDIDAEVVAPWLLAVPLAEDAAEVAGDVLGEPLLGEVTGVDDGVGEGVDVEVALIVAHCQTVGVELTVPETTFDPPGVDARVCGAIADVTMSPAAVVSKTPPVLRPNDPGRTRAKHM
jgi:hypothetical protein